MSQNAQNTYTFPSPSDRQIVTFFDNITRVASETPLTFRVFVGHEELGAFSSADQFFQKFETPNWDNSKLITRIYILIRQKYNLEFHRYLTVDGKQTPSIFENEIFFEKQNSNPPEDLILYLKVLQQVEDFRSKLTLSMNIITSNDDFRNAYANQIAALTDLHIKIVKDAEDTRVRQEKDLETKRNILEEQAVEERKKNLEELEISRQKLSIEAEALSVQKKALDDRSHMHARREMRGRITTDLRDRLSKPAASKSVIDHRKTITWICGILFAVFFSSSIFSAVELTQLSYQSQMQMIPFYVSSARFAASVAALAGIGFYLLGFLRKVHDSDVRSERDLERYLYDVDRSSWVIETVLEAKSKEGAYEQGEIPIDWIKGVTHGLFARAEGRDDESNALDGISSLLNFAAEAKFGPAGPEFKLTKGGAKQLARKIEKEEARD